MVGLVFFIEGCDVGVVSGVGFICGIFWVVVEIVEKRRSVVVFRRLWVMYCCGWWYCGVYILGVCQGFWCGFCSN